MKKLLLFALLLCSVTSFGKSIKKDPFFKVYINDSLSIECQNCSSKEMRTVFLNDPKINFTIEKFMFKLEKDYYVLYLPEHGLRFFVRPINKSSVGQHLVWMLNYLRNNKQAVDKFYSKMNTEEIFKDSNHSSLG